MHEMATQGIPVGLIPILIDAGRGLQLITGTGLISGSQSPHMRTRFTAVPDTSDHHRTCILGDGSVDHLLQELMQGRGLIFIPATRSQPILLSRSTR